MAGHINVVIKLDLGLIPFGVFVWSLRQWQSIGTVQCFIGLTFLKQ